MKKTNEFLQLKEQERDVRRNLIMDAAERVFASKSFDKVNMREIAKEAGISPGTIYTYFPDQETLFIETSMCGAEELVQLMRVVADKTNRSVEEAAGAYIDFFMDHYEYLRMMQHCMLYGKFSSEESLERLLRVYRMLFEQIDRIVQDAKIKIPQGKLRVDSHLFFAFVNGIIFSFARAPRRSEEEIRAHMKSIVKRLNTIFTNRLPEE